MLECNCPVCAGQLHPTVVQTRYIRQKGCLQAEDENEKEKEKIRTGDRGVPIDRDHWRCGCGQSTL